MPLPPHPPLSARFAEWLIAYRWWLAAVAVVLAAMAWRPAQGLQFDRRIEQMFPADDPAVGSYQRLRDRFGGNAVVMLVYRDPELFTPQGLERADGLSDAVRAVVGVRGVLSVSEVGEALDQVSPGGLLGLSGEPAILGDGPLATAFRDLFAGYTHNHEGTHAAIVAMLDPQQQAATDGYADTVRDLRAIAADLPDPLPHGVLVGEPVLVTEGFQLVSEDGQRLATTTVALLSVVVLVLFRSLRWVAAQLAVIYWSDMVTRASIHVSGLELSMVSSMLTAIITVVAVAALIHIALRFQLRLRRGDRPRAAAVATLSRLLPPIFWACLTDAIGFAALMASSVGPVRDFGLMMACGASAVLIALLLIVPAAMLLPPHPAAVIRHRIDRWIGRKLVRLTRCLLDWRPAVFTATIAVAALTAFGLTRLQIETNFLRNFRADSQIARSYALVESELGGAGVWDVLLPAPPDLSGEYLASVRQLEQRLRQIRIDDYPAARITKALSIADADEAAAKSDNPLISFAPPSVRLAGMRATMPVFIDALITPADAREPRWLRVMLRSPEGVASEGKAALIEQVEQAVRQHTAAEPWQTLVGADGTANEDAANEDAAGDGADAGGRSASGEVTGYYVLLARLVLSLLADQWICLGLAAAAVLLMLAVAFRSLSLASLAMVPNLLPVLAVLATLGLVGQRMNMGGAMIAAVSIGLTIDGSIHFLTTYRRTRRRFGRGSVQSVLRAQSQVGLAVLLATVALTFGFAVLTTSPFVPTATFGLLLSAALIAGTTANLTLLPLLLASRQRRAA